MILTEKNNFNLLLLVEAKRVVMQFCCSAATELRIVQLTAGELTLHYSDLHTRSLSSFFIYQN